MRFAAFPLSLLLAVCAAAAESDEFRSEFVDKYCVACHSGAAAQNGFRIDGANYDPADADSRSHWLKVIEYVEGDVMPPQSSPHMPSDDERTRLKTDIEADFASAATQTSGTLVRRLNRIEYLNTLRDIFEIREIRLPPTFPDETPSQRFDTMSEGVYLTPGHLDAYLDVATDIADRMVPLPGAEQVTSKSDRPSIGQDPARTKFWLHKGDDTGLYFTGINIAGWSGALWDKAFTAHASGVYRVRLKVSAEAETGADGKPLRLGFYAL